MKDKTLAIRGDNVPKWKTKRTKKKIRYEVEKAIDKGYNKFISNFEDGVGLLFAEVVIELKKEHKLFLEAAISSPERLENRSKRFSKLLEQADGVIIISNHKNYIGELEGILYLYQNSDYSIHI